MPLMMLVTKFCGRIGWGRMNDCDHLSFVCIRRVLYLHEKGAAILEIRHYGSFWWCVHGPALAPVLHEPLGAAAFQWELEMIELKDGMVAHAKKIDLHIDGMTFSYNAPRGESFVVLLLGAEKPNGVGTGIKVEEWLNNRGWKLED